MVGHANVENIDSSFEYVNKFDRFSTIRMYGVLESIHLTFFVASPFLAHTHTHSLAGINIFIHSLGVCVSMVIRSIEAGFSQF